MKECRTARTPHSAAPWKRRNHWWARRGALGIFALTSVMALLGGAGIGGARIHDADHAEQDASLLLTQNSEFTSRTSAGNEYGDDRDSLRTVIPEPDALGRPSEPGVQSVEGNEESGCVARQPTYSEEAQLDSQALSWSKSRGYFEDADRDLSARYDNETLSQLAGRRLAGACHLG